MFSRLTPVLFYFSPDGDPAGGAESSESPAVPQSLNPAAPAAQDTNPQVVKDSVRTALADILGRNNNDPMTALMTLVGHNHKLESRVETAEKNVISKSDREFLSAAKSLGLNAEQLKAVVKEHGSLMEEKTKAGKMQSLKEAAAADGINADLLASLEGATAVDFVVRGEGEAKQGFVKIKDEKGETEKRLGVWAAEKWPALAESLKVSAAASGAAAPVRKATPYGQSAPAASGTSESLYDRIRQSQEAKNKNTTTATKSVAERIGKRL